VLATQQLTLRSGRWPPKHLIQTAQHLYRFHPLLSDSQPISTVPRLVRFAQSHLVQKMRTQIAW